MEKYRMENDITVFYVTATSFPEGVMAAHQKLHTLVPFSRERMYFGLSRPEGDGGISYKAAAQEMTPGEAAQYVCDTIVLKKGDYQAVELHNYMSDLPAIGLTFQQMIAQPAIDPEGYCVEWYVSEKELKCLVRLADK